MRSSARSPIPAAVPGCGRLGIWMRIFGGLSYFLAALLDRALVGELAQDAFQLRPVGILQAELPRDFAGSDFSGMRTDEGDDGVPLWKNLVALPGHSIRLPCRRFSWRRALPPWKARFWPSPARAPC